jgi:hypothetical protein
MSRLAECRHEADLVAAVTSGRWPAAVDQALREHVASCRVCADVLQVAEVMTAIEQETLADTRLPSPGQVWWRAQVRARREAAAVAARPVMVAQAVGAAAALGLVAGVISWKWPTIALAAGTWVSQPLASFDLGVVAWLGVAMGAVLGPLAIYAAVREP